MFEALWAALVKMHYCREKRKSQKIFILYFIFHIESQVHSFLFFFDRQVSFSSPITRTPYRAQSTFRVKSLHIWKASPPSPATRLITFVRYTARARQLFVTLLFDRADCQGFHKVSAPAAEIARHVRNVCVYPPPSLDSRTVEHLSIANDYEGSSFAASELINPLAVWPNTVTLHLPLF